MAKLVQHIKNESLVDFVKEAQDILNAEYAKQVQELEELLIKCSPTELLAEAAMTRKHFEMAASTIKAHPDKAKRKELAAHHAEIFAKANPRFDKKKFFQASGVED